MKRPRFTEAQIIGIPRGREASVRVAARRRGRGLSSPIFCNRRVRCDGPEVSEARRLKAPRDDSASSSACSPTPCSTMSR